MAKKKLKRIISRNQKRRGSYFKWIIPALIIILFFGAFFTNKTSNISMQNQSVTNSLAGSDTTVPTSVQKKVILKSEDAYDITLPDGWSKVTEAREGKSDLTVKYGNTKGDYLEVTVNPAGSGFEADEVWDAKATNTNDGVIVYEKSGRCTKETNVFCSDGDNKLTIGVKSDKVKANDYFFLVGNNFQEENINTDIYQQIIEGIRFK